MKVKLILPALTEATSPFWRPIKYSLFPPLGLATLASVGIHRARRNRACQRRRRPATSGVRRWLEEIRAAVGPGDPREARRNDAAGARNDPQRIWPAFAWINRARTFRPGDPAHTDNRDSMQRGDHLSTNRKRIPRLGP